MFDSNAEIGASSGNKDGHQDTDSAPYGRVSGRLDRLGRLISLGGLPLVWYRIMVSVAVLAIVMAFMGRLHKVGWAAFAKIAGCGGILALHWVAFYASIQASNVSISVACIATSCFFTTLLDPLINRKRISWIDFAFRVHFFNIRTRETKST